ncbi:MauE/DoxX family redox-associated membrane protein [Achromobacter xylosoxidans]|uniref:MauE/DoxX family redox-associated membrane protein n=1 Tax=Alcaligenes xylosoxydans xylosoxydans TaxID=85698 RepID=UPI003F5E1B96
MTDPVLLYAASAALACVLLLGALEKLKDMAAFAAAVQAYEIVPAAFGGLFAWGYVLAEALAGALLLAPGLRSPGGGAGAAGAGAGHRRRGGEPGTRSPRHRLRLRRSRHARRGGARRRPVVVDGAAQRLAGVVDAAGFRCGAGRIAQPAVG